MRSFYFSPSNGSFRLTKKGSSIEKEILGTTQSKELVESFYFAPNTGSFRLTKKGSSIRKGILNTTQPKELADDDKDVNKSKRDFLKIAGVAGLGLVGTALFPKKADALILGGTPTSSVVGVKNASNTRINPATEETVSSLATEATVSTLLKPTDLTFDTGTGDLQVKVTAVSGAGSGGFSTSADETTKSALVDAQRHVQVDVLTSALPSSASTETTLQTISFGGKQYALKMTSVGSVDYIAEATVGTATSTALWRAKKVDGTGTGILITWADGNENFDNSATDLPGLTYS